MAQLAMRLSLDAWAAHSAGLFEECGKAVLFRHAPDHYRAMQRATTDDSELVTLEHAGFGVSHDALGAALCESWGLGPAAVASVRFHVLAQRSWALPELPARRPICALSVLARVIMAAPERLDEATEALAVQTDLDLTLMRRAARQTIEQRTNAAANGRP
jgi:HD-like signal output (HDOD) protein